EQISVVKEGVTAFGTGYITAMHDPTEGGLANGVHELCDASGVGCNLELSRIPLNDATKQICEHLEINPLELISSGSMLISCEERHSTQVIQELDAVGINATIIGTLVEDSTFRKIIIDNQTHDLKRPATDALWTALKKVIPS
ncbi:MAG: AIR synthase-related protein, partial [Candidatus Thorarchaeota archaeon]